MSKTVGEKMMPIIQDELERYGCASFKIKRNPSRTWGVTCALWYGGTRLWVASGCGYDKDTACVEHAGYLTTGKRPSICNSFYNIKKEDVFSYYDKEGARPEWPYRVEVTYDGDREASFTIHKA
jgi:hypothetical protein